MIDVYLILSFNFEPLTMLHFLFTSSQDSLQLYLNLIITHS
jgi:hypothetical protein